MDAHSASNPTDVLEQSEQELIEKLRIPSEFKQQIALKMQKNFL